MQGFVSTRPWGRRNGSFLALRFALRELRGGLRGFYIFIACIALGVAAISGVTSVSRSLTAGIQSEGTAILGGDMAFSLVHRQAEADELAFLATHGEVGRVATMRAMARVPETVNQSLVELKAVDGAYPLYGTLRLGLGGSLDEALEKRDGVWGAVADLALLARLDLAVGEEISLGKARFRIADTIEAEPDKLDGGLEFGPRLMISDRAIEETGLVQPGSLVRWTYRLRLAPNASESSIAAIRDAAGEAFPEAGWRIRSRANAAPGLQRNIDRFSQFLTLVGLTALVVGGVGVANAVRAFLDAKRGVIATFKCIGASGAFVFRVYLWQILVLAAIGIAIGLAIGAAIPFAAAGLLSQVLPIKASAGFYPAELGLGLVYGLLTALAFALWPLGRAHDVPPSALFRDDLGNGRWWPRKRYILATAATVTVLAGLALWLAADKRIALVYIAATAAAFVVLMAVSRLIMFAARRLPAVRSTELRLALGNIHRPGALTPSVVLSLGLGLTLLVALALIDGNLRRELGSTIAEKAPSFFFVDIQNSEKQAFDVFLRQAAAGAAIETAPMLRGRITQLNGVPADQIKPDPSGAWALRGDRGITYSERLPDNSALIAGEWWPKDYSGVPLVSFESGVAEALRLGIGDTVTVNVLGRPVTARIANLRSVEWESLAINFVMVFSPNTFAGAPHAHLATVTWDDGVAGTAATQREIALLKEVTAAFPTVTAVRVKDAIDQVNALVAQLAWAIRGAASVTLVASVLVLAGALAAGHRHRIYDAVVLKMLGATRQRLIAAYMLEYAVLGLVTALFAVLAGAAAAGFVVTQVMGLGFAFLPATAAGAAVVAAVLTIGFGLFGTWRVLGERPAPVLRNL